MISSDAKRIVFIKNISSDLVEEAILILKPDNTGKSGVEHEIPKRSSSKVKNGLLLKEAEDIINSYIKENNLQVFQRRSFAYKFKIPGKRMMVRISTTVLLLFAIALLVYLSVKLF